MAGRIIDVTMQLIDKVTGPLSGITGSLADSNKNWQRAGKEITNTGKSIANVGADLTTKVTMPIVGMGTYAVKTAADFEKSMDKVQSISGAAGGDMEMLSGRAQEMGAKTKFSASEAADAFSYMAMAGWKTEQMMSGIEGVMYLAGATETDLAQTSDIVTDAMTAFGMAADGTSTVLKDGVETEVSNVTRFVDVMAATANNANTNVEMLGESFKYVAPVAGSMGYSVEDVNIALGLMANSGIKASSAGTALRSLMTRMASPTKQSAAAMEELGIYLDDGEGNMLSFMEVMQDLRSSFPQLQMSFEEFDNALDVLNSQAEAGELTQKEYEKELDRLIERGYGAEGALKAQAASMLAGKTGMAGLLAIINATDEEFDALTQSVYESSGACENMYNVAQDNLIGRLTIVKSTLESVAIAFGNELLPYIEKGTAWIQSLADKFNSLDSSQRQQIIKWLGMAAAIGPALLAFGKVTMGVGKLVTTIGKIGGAISKAGSLMAALATPGGIVIAVLAAIGIAIALVVTHWDEVKAAAERFFTYIEPVINFLKDQWTELGNKFKEVWENHLKPVWEQLKEKTSESWTTLQPILTKIGEYAKDIFEIRFKLAIETAVEIIKFFAEVIGVVVEAVIGVLDGINEFMQGVFTGDWERCWNGVKEIFSSVWDGIKGIASAACDFIGGLVDGLVNAWNGLLTLIGKAKDESKNVPSAGSSGGFAVGTSYFKGGTAKVNERGAEIIDLPRGSRIYPHAESLKMAYNEGRASGGGKGNITITVAKLAENIQVRSDSDIEAIAAALANKLEQTAQNIGGGELGYIY